MFSVLSVNRWFQGGGSCAGIKDKELKEICRSLEELE